ncbi:type IV pilus modification PilV family protein [Amphritea balenae]|uniref:Prepilin-type N-terminal cleavage/methylation domain-containing protein n=1 Tax=Amphritea balenae TaxID=452629 RepID=A0A3P1SK58_9GAMM|nr:hypothetical protein [Amphritea balenae]RRC97324.1 hypothetical protein EHS89_17600 [Amphritea balenae]GGK83480.1 hypothetical protein GCM10007941_37510 [Amphritea balenae]
MKLLRHQTGIALIEVVIGLFIMGFGLVALAMFGNGLFSDSGQVKAKTEALQLAQQELEILREDAESDGLTTITEETGRTIPGVNASYNLVSTIAFVTDPDHAAISVAVSWTDKQGDQSVSLNSLIAVSDSDALGGLVAGSLEGGGLIDPPDGSATYGDGIETYDENDDEGDNEVSDSDTPIGTKIYHDGDEYILTSSEDDKVLLKNSDSFTRVVGRVYIDSGFSVDEADILIVPSDTGVCRKTLTDTDGFPTAMTSVYFDVDADTLTNTTSGATGTVTHLYDYFSYTCYFGTGWYGNIGVIRDDNPNTNDRICGGDPVAVDDGTDASRHPQLMATRTYRGYTKQVNLDSTPAVDADGNRLYLSAGMVAAALYGDTTGDSDDNGTHDFLLTSITGTVSDSDCLEPLEGSAHESSLTGNTDPAKDEFYSNNGDFVCIVDAQDETNCPDILPTSLGEAVAATGYTLTGTISLQGDNLSETLLNSLAMTTSQGEDCLIDNYDTGAATADWDCSIYMAGTWSGNIALTSSSENLQICTVSSYNLVELSGGSSDVFDFEVSNEESCSSSQFTITGVVRNLDQNNSADLSSTSVQAESGGDVIECPGSLGTLSSARDGENTAEYSCVVSDGFNGQITLINLPSGFRITNTYPDYSGSGVTSDLTGQDIEIR